MASVCVFVSWGADDCQALGSTAGVWALSLDTLLDTQLTPKVFQTLYSNATLNSTHHILHRIFNEEFAHAQWIFIHEWAASCSVMVLTAAWGRPAGLWLSASLCHQKHRAWQQKKNIKIQHNTQAPRLSEPLILISTKHNAFLIQYMAACKHGWNMKGYKCCRRYKERCSNWCFWTD